MSPLACGLRGRLDLCGGEGHPPEFGFLEGEEYEHPSDPTPRCPRTFSAGHGEGSRGHFNLNDAKQRHLDRFYGSRNPSNARVSARS